MTRFQCILLLLRVVLLNCEECLKMSARSKLILQLALNQETNEYNNFSDDDEDNLTFATLTPVPVPIPGKDIKQILNKLLSEFTELGMSNKSV